MIAGRWNSRAQLKSGAPLMTVESIDQTGVLCTWLDGKNNHKRATFPEATLGPYEDDTGGLV
jgi:uncharacterized protein YodC (DUF2158 family)